VGGTNTVIGQLPEFIDASKLDCEYSCTALDKMLKINGSRVTSFINKRANNNEPIDHKQLPHYSQRGFKRVYRLRDVLAAALNSGGNLQPTDEKQKDDFVKNLSWQERNLAKEVANLEAKKKGLLKEIDFLSGNLSDISPVLSQTNFSLVPINEIVRKSSSYGNVCGVYFLIKNSEIVYIGQSINIAARITSHKDKDFDSVSYVTCKRSELDILESLYIIAYNPVLNGEVKAGGGVTTRACTPISLDNIVRMFSG
jgi:hypothetical protein